MKEDSRGRGDMRIRKGEEETSVLFRSILFKFSDRRHVGVRKANGPSHLEASLSEGRHPG